MNEIKMVLSYLLFSLIGLGIILLGVIFSNFGSQIIPIMFFVVGFAICVYSFFAARKLID